MGSNPTTSIKREYILDNKKILKVKKHVILDTVIKRQNKSKFN